MLEREKVKKLVKEVVDKNKLQSCFIPIIEEFFFRVADQLEWNDEELNNAIKRYEQVVNIKFVNFYKIRAGIPIKKYKEKCADTVYKVYNEKISMRFDIDYLKGILEFDKEKIEKFINTAMHEQGHSIQYQKKENNVSSGFSEFKIINQDGIKRIFLSDRIIDEFAEIINEARLVNGNIRSDKYSGYEDIQIAGKIIINSSRIS